jgi:hypothetical protein
MCYCTGKKAEVIDLETGSRINEINFEEMKSEKGAVQQMFLMRND